MAQTSSYDVVVAAIATTIRVDKIPTESPLDPGHYSFGGALETTVTQEALDGQTINLVVDGLPVQQMVTNLSGLWAFDDFILAPGATYAVKAVFDGTVDYEASESPTYNVTPFVKLATTMDVTTPPPATAGVGVSFPFAGALKETVALVAIEGATVNLYVDALLADTTTTGVGGAWNFDITLDLGTHPIYAEFPGDAVYLGCAKKLSTRWLPPAGLLAVAGGLVGIAWLGR